MSAKGHKKSSSWHGSVAETLSSLIGKVLTSRSEMDLRIAGIRELSRSPRPLRREKVHPAVEERPFPARCHVAEAAAAEAAAEEVPDELRCQVCLELYLEPLRLNPCSHSFCSPCLRLLAQAQLSAPVNTCPLCRSPVFWTSPNPDLSAAAAAQGGALALRKAWLKLNPGVAQLPLPGASFRLLGVGGPGPAIRALFVSILCLGLFFLLFLPGVYISSHLFDYLVLNLTELEFGATVAALGRTEWLSLSQSLFPVLSLLAVLFLSSYLVFAA